MSDHRYPKREEEAEDSRESRASTSMVHSEDVELRKRGFRIHARPKNGEPVWERGGVLFRQSEAIKRYEQPK